MPDLSSSRRYSSYRVYRGRGVSLRLPALLYKPPKDSGPFVGPVLHKQKPKEALMDSVKITIPTDRLAEFLSEYQRLGPQVKVELDPNVLGVLLSAVLSQLQRAHLVSKVITPEQDMAAVLMMGLSTGFLYRDWLLGPAPRIYVAGPYSAPTIEGREANARKAIDVGLALFKKGYVPFIPHLNHYVDEGRNEAGLDENDYLAWDFGWLATCDLLFFIGPSPGANIELAVAQALGLSIFKDLADVPDLTKENENPEPENPVRRGGRTSSGLIIP